MLLLNPGARKLLPGRAANKRAQVAFDRRHNPLRLIVYIRAVWIDEAEIEAKKGVPQVIAPALRAILECGWNRGGYTSLDQLELVKLRQVGREVTLADQA